MRVLVCGGRDFDDWEKLDTSLKIRNHPDNPITHIIHGAARGADTMAGEWAEINGIPLTRFHASWKKYGVAAGPIRNQQMIDEGKPDLVIAFPGGKGSTDMIDRAKKAGIKVIEIP